MVKEVRGILARENHMSKYLKVGEYLTCLGKSKGPWCGINIVMANEAGKVNTG